MTSIEGFFYCANSSQQQAATLIVSDEGQVSVIIAEQVPESHEIILFRDLNISSRLGNTPRYLEFINGDRFETGDNDQIDALQKQHEQARGYRLLHVLESRFSIVLLATVVTVLFVAVFVKYGVPATASSIAQLLPESTSQYLGQGTLNILDEAVFDESELPAARQQKLIELFDGYSQSYPRYPVKVLFRKSDKIGANAMALPDGHIIFTDAMVELAQRDEELVAIFGHEVGHVVHRHLLRRVIQDSILTMLLVLITGDVSSASSVVIAVPGLLLELSYSRDFEREADDFAYQFLIDHQLAPKHFASIMQRLESSHSDQGSDSDREQKSHRQGDEDYDTSYLSSHPATQERIQRFLNGSS